MKPLFTMLIGLSLTSLAIAKLPEPSASAKTAEASLKSAALNFSDNPSDASSAAFKAALLDARRAGALAGFERADKFNEAELKRTAKFIQVAEVCELQGYKGVLIVDTSVFVGAPTPKQIEAFKTKCKADTVKVQPYGPAGAGK